MNSYIATNLVYNELEYFCYLNHWLLFLFFFIVTFYFILKITTLYFNKIYYNDTFIEFICTQFSLIFLLFIISPALIILLDIDTIIMPSFIIYNLGYQWAWTYSISYLHSNIGYTSYNDHYIISSYFYSSVEHSMLSSSTANNVDELIDGRTLNAFNWRYINMVNMKTMNFNVPKEYINFNVLANYSMARSMKDNNIDQGNSNNPLLNTATNIEWHSIKLANSTSIINNYLFEVNSYLIIPLYSCIKIYCFSLDVIHSLSFYSFGIKIDAIPGRINLTSSLRLFIKGINRGFCYELCGEQHNTMINMWINV